MKNSRVLQNFPWAMFLALKALKEADDAGVKGIGLQCGSGTNPLLIASANLSALTKASSKNHQAYQRQPVATFSFTSQVSNNNEDALQH
jgi:hypothetical protein